MSIYTKKGDRGKTALFDSQNSQRKRVSKSSLRIETIGSVDELNSYLGVVVSGSKDDKLNDSLELVQSNLLSIGSILAGSKLRLSSVQTSKLEEEIDEMEGRLPVLKNFILPGGNSVAARLHYARALTRKVERKVVKLNEVEPVKPQILVYINRLSDYLFMLARDTNFKTEEKEKIWKK